MYQEVKEAAKQPTVWAAIMGLINPVTACIGIGGLVIYALIKSDKPKKPLLTAPKAINEPLANRPQAVSPTAGNGDLNGSEAVQGLSDEAENKELIRKAMSELGKRSGKARARKREQMESAKDTRQTPEL